MIYGKSNMIICALRKDYLELDNEVEEGSCEWLQWQKAIAVVHSRDGGLMLV